MSSNKYYCCEITCSPDCVFLDSTLMGNATKLNVRVLNEKTKNISFFPVITESHEKSIVSWNISPCKKIMFIIVECHNVPTKKYVEYVFSNGQLIEPKNTFRDWCGTTHPESEEKKEIITQTPLQPSIMNMQDWCGTCNKH